MGKVKIFIFSEQHRHSEAVPSCVFALKCLKKQHVVETQQQEHVFSEKNILMSCRHNFITR